MKSEWKITSNSINRKKVYAVYRKIDVSAVDHSGNREMATEYFNDRETAENIAKELNAKEGSKNEFDYISKHL